MPQPKHPTYELFAPPGGIAYARDLAQSIGGNLRAPHHTASHAAMGDEMALAAGGVLLLDDAGEFSPAVLARIASVWAAMTPAVRPRIVAVLHTTKNNPKAAEADAKRFAKLYDGWRPF